MIEKCLNKIICGDCFQILREFPDNSVDLVLTSPPYFCQREYGGGGIGNEQKVDDYINKLVEIFRQCARVTKKTGTIVFNLGDKYIEGNLLLVPYRFAIEVQKDNIVKPINELTWVKVNPAPKQCSKKLIPATEPFFIFAKTDDYYFNKDAFLEYRDKYLNGGQAGGRLTQIENKGFTIIKIYGNSIRKDTIESNVETIKGNIHPAVYPEFIIQAILKLLTKEGDIVLNPFLGSGTTAIVAQRLKRNYIGIEIHSEYVNYAENRIKQNANNHTLDLFI